MPFRLPMTILALPLIAAMPAYAPASDNIRVMSFNVRYATANDGPNAWPARRDFLVRTIQAFAPDLLGTQETLAVQRDFLKQALGGYEVLAAGRDDGAEKGEMMALYYRKDRFEKLGGGHFWLSETPDVVGSKSWDSSLPRMVTWLKLLDLNHPGSVPIVVFNTHFDHRGKQARLESAKLIRRKLLELAAGCRMILTGDFNSGEGSPPYLATFAPAADGTAALVDTFRARTPERTDSEGTYSGFDANSVRGERIDWIGCSADFSVKAASIDRTSHDGRTPSDHFPVTAVLVSATTAASTRAPGKTANPHFRNPSRSRDGREIRSGTDRPGHM